MLMFDKLHTYFDHLGNTEKNIMDITSISVVVGSLAQLLPAMAAILSIVWSAIRIYETNTIQKWLGKINNTQE